MPKKIIQGSGWFLFLVIIYFPIFQNIDSLPVQLWDESRNANNAFEMTQNGNLLIRYFDGKPDMWELNPPLLTWLQAGSFKLFGFNELALRLPTCLAVLATVFIIIFFIKTEFGNYWGGIFSGLILLTSSGYIHQHIARTGDHDALLVFFITGATLNFYKYLKYYAETSRFLIYTTLFLILAVLTKSIIGIFVLPGFFIYALIKKKLKLIFRDYRTYISFAIFSAVILTYYLLRESYNPGYLNYVWNDQLFPRYLNFSTNYDYHDDSPWFYIKNLFLWRYSAWIMTLPLLFIALKIKPIKEYRDLIMLFYSICISILIIISIGTKNDWYDAPIFPLLAMLSGIGIYLTMLLIRDALNTSDTMKNVLFIFLGLILFFTPYRLIIEKIYKPKEELTNLYYGPFMEELQKEKPSYRNYKVFCTGYNAHIKYYKKVFNEIHNYNITYDGENIENFAISDTIMSCDREHYNILDSYFELSEIETFKHCRLYVVESIKNSSFVLEH